jgi:glycerophosphoryl diester phosphodiesterase
MQTHPHVYAHRGGRLWAPENTRAAFAKSLQAKVHGIEIDVHRCKTNEIVVIHDHDVSGTTDGVGLIKDLTLSQIQSFSAGNHMSPEFADEKVPLLTEVLEQIQGRLVINIEIKNFPDNYPGIEDDLLRILSYYPYPETILLSSFDHEMVRLVSKKAPHIKTAICHSGMISEPKRYAKRVGFSYMIPDFVTIRPDHVQTAHEQGLALNCWTMNSRDQWLAAWEMHLDGIITDDPAGCLQFLSTLPAWMPERRSKKRWWHLGI